MIRTLDHKLIDRPGGVSELYDLRADPRECRNVHGEAAYAIVRGDLERQLLDWYIRTADVTPFAENPRGLPTRPVARAAGVIEGGGDARSIGKPS